MDVILEFEFVTEKNEVVENLNDAEWMIAIFNCAECGFSTCFSKKYQPVPLHYESLLLLCKPVTCRKCGQAYRHIRNEEGEDIAEAFKMDLVDPMQLRLF